jgi:hypothetical protein
MAQAAMRRQGRVTPLASAGVWYCYQTAVY